MRRHAKARVVYLATDVYDLVNVCVIGVEVCQVPRRHREGREGSREGSREGAAKAREGTAKACEVL